MKTKELATGTLYAVSNGYRVTAGVVVDLENRYSAPRFRIKGEPLFATVDRERIAGNILVALTTLTYATPAAKIADALVELLTRTPAQGLDLRIGQQENSGSAFFLSSAVKILGPWDEYVTDQHAVADAKVVAASEQAAARAALAARYATLRRRLTDVGLGLPETDKGRVVLNTGQLELLLDLLDVRP